ncbi:efflux transporter outer membrane subunit [Flavitalea flava]
MASKIKSAGRFSTKRAAGYAALLLVAGWLGGCKAGKDYQRAEVPAPAAFRTTSGSTAAPTATADTSSIANIEWKQFFTDTTLQGLIARGIAYNYDLQLAIKRIDAANSRLKQAKLLQLPNVNFQVTAQTSRPSDNSLNGLSTQSFLKTNHLEDYNANIGISWEADIWGKIRRQKEATVAQYLQSYEAAKAVQTQLVSDIAQGFYNLLMLDAQLDIAVKNLALRDSTLQVTRFQKDAGDVTLLAVEQAEAQKQTTAILIPQLEQAIAIQENALSLLTGEVPHVIARNPNGLLQFNVPENLPTGLPAAIVSRRPDVRSNELALMSSNALVGVAQGNMYPSLVITASGGLNSFKASNWLNIPGSLFGSVVGGLTQPIFQHREFKTKLELAKNQQEQSQIIFRQSVLNAVGEVSDALVKVDKLKLQKEISAAQVETLHHAINDAHLLFKSGLANYLEVITAQTSALQAELNLADVERQQLSSVVDLYRSLGGGWK